MRESAAALMTLEKRPEPHVEPRPATGRQYMYAVIHASDSVPESCPGVDGQGIYKIEEGRLAAVAGGVAAVRIRPERRHLAAHQEVLKQLLSSATPLPITFGTVADNPKAVRQFLAKHRSELLNQLKRVRGKVEMGLRVTWQAPNIFEYFVNTHASLREARDRLVADPRHSTQDQKIETGRMFERLLTEDRARHAAKVEAILDAAGIECKANKSKTESEVMNLACLVERDRLDDFGRSVFEAAQLFDHDFAFDYSGPWAPHNFVAIEPIS